LFFLLFSIVFFLTNIQRPDLKIPNCLLMYGFKAFATDLIIIRLGENVDSKEASGRGFDIELERLIAELLHHKNVVVCITRLSGRME
jgi:hypothetical protein